MAATDDLTLTHHISTEAAKLMDELCEVYADAYGAVPGEDIREKSSAFRERATAAQQGLNYSLVTAHVGDQLVGFAFGYSLRAERGWWDGLKPEPPEGFTNETGSRTVVLSEIEVRRAWQGKGIGRTVHDSMPSCCSAPRNAPHLPAIPKPLTRTRCMSAGAGRRWASCLVSRGRTTANMCGSCCRCHSVKPGGRRPAVHPVHALAWFAPTVSASRVCP